MFKDRRRCPRFGEERRKSENIFCVRIEKGLEDSSQRARVVVRWGFKWTSNSSAMGSRTR